MEVCGTLVYAASPSVNGAYFSALAKNFLQTGATSICLWDPAGSLGSEEQADLIPELRKASQAVPLELKSPCSSGIAERVYLQALELGVNRLHTAVAPLSSGTGMPAMEYFILHHRRQNENITLNEGELSGVSDYFAAIAKAHNYRIGEQLLRDLSALEHQMPVSEVAAIRQIIGVDQPEIDPEKILVEVARIRSDLDAPALAWPIASIMRRQAILNLSDSGRYERMDLDFARLIDRAFSKLPTSIGKKLRKLAQENLKRRTDQDENVAIESETRPVTGVNTTATSLLTEIMCGKNISDTVTANSDISALLDYVDAETPFDQLVGELMKRDWIRSIVISKGDLKFELDNVA